jgi:hypothetical protein
MFERLAIAACAVLTAASSAQAQSVAEYRARVDSLAKIWRPLNAAESKREATRPAELPAESLRAGNLIVRSDTATDRLARAAAARLAPLVERAYGASSALLLRHPLVIASTDNRQVAAVVTSITDSTGQRTLRSSVYPNVDAVLDSWARKIEQVMLDQAGPAARDWVGLAIPLDAPRAQDWTDARIALLFAGSKGTRDCADGNVPRCVQVLGLSETENPIFTFYDASERRALIRSYNQVLRKADPARYDRCMRDDSPAACDSVAELIPSDAVSLPAPASVRLSLVRFALQEGGAGAFDRFLAAGSRRARIEAAARMPVDSVVRQWQETISDTHATSTAIDLTTAVSSLLWAGACAALALRSSRWR